MIQWIRALCATSIILAAIGCGGVSEIDAAKEAPKGPSEAEMKKMMQESKEKGGMKQKLPKGK